MVLTEGRFNGVDISIYFLTQSREFAAYSGPLDDRFGRYEHNLKSRVSTITAISKTMFAKTKFLCHKVNRTR